MKILFIILILILQLKNINLKNSKHVKLSINFYVLRGAILWGDDISLEIDEEVLLVNEKGENKRNIYNICEYQNRNCRFETFHFTIILKDYNISIKNNNGITHKFSTVNKHNWEKIKVVQSNYSTVPDQFSGYVSNLEIDGITQILQLIKKRCEKDTCKGWTCLDIFPDQYICQCDYLVGNGHNCNKTLNSIKNNIQCETFAARYFKFSSKDSWPRIQFLNKDTLISIYNRGTTFIYETISPIFKTELILSKNFNQSGSNIVELSYNINNTSATIIYRHNGIYNTFIVPSPIEGYIGNNLTVGSSSNIGLASKILSTDFTYEDFCEEKPKSDSVMAAKDGKEYSEERNNSSIGQWFDRYRIPFIAVMYIKMGILTAIIIWLLITKRDLSLRMRDLETKLATFNCLRNGSQLDAVVIPISTPVPDNAPDNVTDKKMLIFETISECYNYVRGRISAIYNGTEAVLDSGISIPIVENNQSIHIQNISIFERISTGYSSVRERISAIYKGTKTSTQMTANNQYSPLPNNSDGLSDGQCTSSCVESDHNHCSSASESPRFEIIADIDDEHLLHNNSDQKENCA